MQLRAGEMAQQTGALASPAEDLGSVPSPHMVTHAHLQLQVQGMQCPLLTFTDSMHAHTTHIYVQTLIHKKE